MDKREQQIKLIPNKKRIIYKNIVHKYGNTFKINLRKIIIYFILYHNNIT
jgi:hypothetical protein